MFDIGCGVAAPSARSCTSTHRYTSMTAFEAERTLVTFGRSRHSARVLQSAEVGISKTDSKSDAYENRTKSTQSEGLERNGPRERENLGLRRGQRSAEHWARMPAVIGNLSAPKNGRRTLASDGLAEGVRLGSNGLLIWCDSGSTCECDRNPNGALKRQVNSDQRNLEYHSHIQVQVSMRRSRACAPN